MHYLHDRGPQALITYQTCRFSCKSGCFHVNHMHAACTIHVQYYIHISCCHVMSRLHIFGLVALLFT